jgi:hypothetical protein
MQVAGWLHPGKDAFLERHELAPGILGATSHDADWRATPAALPNQGLARRREY